MSPLYLLLGVGGVPSAILVAVTLLSLSLCLFLLAGAGFLFYQLGIRRYQANKQFATKLTRENIDLDKSFATVLEQEFENRIEEMDLKIRGHRDRMFFLVSNIQQMATTLDKTKLFTLAGDIINISLGVNQIGIYIINREQTEIFPVFSRGWTDFDMKKNYSMQQDNILALCVTRGEFFNRTDDRGEELVRALFGKFTPKISAVLPFFNLQRRAVGAIVLGELQRDLDKNDLKFLQILGNLVGPLMENAAIFDQTKEDLQSQKKLSEQQLAEKKKLKDVFSSYMSPKMIEEALNNPNGLSLGGEKKLISILFSDIENFTTLSENLGPEAVVGLLNEYLGEMTRLVMKYDGFLDKFIGDAVMAEFGAFNPKLDDPLRAVQCAMEMLRTVEQLQKKWIQEGKPLINIRIGINTDEVVVGNVGGKERMEFTAIGDGVNVASRLEGMNKQYGTRLLISEATFRAIGEEVSAEPLGALALKGKAQKMNTYAVIRVKGVNHQLEVDKSKAVGKSEEEGGHGAVAKPEVKMTTREVESLISTVKSAPTPPPVNKVVQGSLGRPCCGGCGNPIIDASSGYCLICGGKLG